MGRTRSIWATLLPLGWLVSVTASAGLMKIFSPAPIGFLAIARGLDARIAAGGAPAELKMWSAQLFNNRVDAVVTAAFLVLVAIVVIANAHVWWLLLSGRHTAQLHEEPYVSARAEAASGPAAFSRPTLASFNDASIQLKVCVLALKTASLNGSAR